MDRPVIRSFVVRIWIEEYGSRDGGVTWRGHITEVASGERGYLKSLDDIAVFIAPYFNGTPVAKRRPSRLIQWLRER